MEQLYYIFSKYYREIIYKYISSSNANPNIEDLLNKKFIHTFRVVSNVKEICIKENINEHLSFLCEIAALFHDIGRFEQALTYGHFNDSNSIDHALTSSNIFFQNKDILRNLISEEDILKVKEAILLHNKIDIPDNSNSDIITILKVLKDADKLNILSINLKSGFISFDGTLKSTTSVNEKCLKEFINMKIVSNNNIETILDNNIKLLSWIYDLNYKTSLEIYHKEGFIDILTDLSYANNNVSIENILSDIKEIATNYITTKL